MAELGIWNDLNVLRLTPEGALLEDGEQGELLLPLHQMPPAWEPGQPLKVFVYLDADGHLTATTRKPLAQRGETRDGYIKALRADHKLNISLSAPGYAKVGDIAQGVLDVLKRQGGFMAVTDKSRPEEIYALFGISKKVFKQTLGALYKSRRIVMGVEGIRLAQGDSR